MTTLVTDITVRKTELYNRQKIFDNAYGIKFDSSVSMLDVRLENTFELKDIKNYLLISSDSIIDLEITQSKEEIDADGNSAVIQNTINLTVSGVFVTYAAFEKIVLKTNSKINRVPKVSLVFS